MWYVIAIYWDGWVGNISEPFTSMETAVDQAEIMNRTENVGKRHFAFPEEDLSYWNEQRRLAIIRVDMQVGDTIKLW